MVASFAERGFWLDGALKCALGAAAAAAVSIAASQILLGLALACMLAARLRWRLPQGWPLLAFFFLWTLAALALSDAPAAGLPQLKKFYAWLSLFAVLSTVSRGDHARWLAWGWLTGGALSALWGCGQFAVKYIAAQRAGTDFYTAYIGARITGFNSHWMTFSGQMMIAMMAGAALALWACRDTRLRRAAWACLVLMGVALVLAMTRGVWIGAFAGALYLLWHWRRRAAAALPLVAVLVLWLGPAAVRERALSIVRPRGVTDSNLHRIYTWRTGVEIVKRHPWFGLGPERIGAHFRAYIPADLPPEPPPGYYAHLHNIYLQWAAERGLPAALAAVLFFIWQLAASRRRARQQPELAWVHRGAAAVLIAVLVTGLFEYNLGDSEVLAMTLGWTALSDGLGRQAA
ncbi:MAG: O-antigen ligase family protein [Bryobacteraceae bacterium]|nr:O-antigen ligase family protein [Bryobacteraceae bacterium]